MEQVDSCQTLVQQNDGNPVDGCYGYHAPTDWRMVGLMVIGITILLLLVLIENKTKEIIKGKKK